MDRRTVVDCDQHVFEYPDMWREHCDPTDRHMALRLDPDEAGHWWLTTGDDRRIELCFRQRPGRTDDVGRQVLAARAGEPAAYDLSDIHPPAYVDPRQRITVLDEGGIDAAVLFPNYGLGYEGPLRDDPRALMVNMRAWNRYAAEIAHVDRSRLFPVGHVSLRDPGFVEAEVASLAAAGVRAVMVAPALVDGRRLSHPAHDRIWASMVDHAVTPVFHVGAFTRPFAPGWFEGDPDEMSPVLLSVFLGTAPALALADLAVNGVFDRHPDLRVGVMELSAIWVPMFLLTLDGGFDFHARFNGRPLRDLERRPSEYIRQHVRIASFSYEDPVRLSDEAGDLFMACSDYPHSEGTATMLEDYGRAGASPSDAAGLFGANVSWLLGLS